MTGSPEDETRPDVAAARSRSVRATLLLFTAALVLPILLFVGFLLWQIAIGERHRLEGDASDIARAGAVTGDRELTGRLASLDVLSLSPYLQTGDLRSFYRQSEDLARRQDIVPVLTDLSGRQLVNLRVPFGTELPVSNVPRDPAAFEANRPFVTDLFRGLVSNELLFSGVLPVLRDGRPIYVLSFRLAVDRLRRILREADIPDGYTVSIVDRSGVIMARSARHDEFVGQLATADLRAAATGESGRWTGWTIEGEKVLGAYARSKLSGFRAAVGIRVADLNAPLWRSLTLFAGLGIMIVGLSVGLGLLLGRRITAPMAALTDRAARLGRGAPVLPRGSGLREVDEVGQEITAAAAARAAREDDLRDANEEVQRFAYIVSHDLRSPLVNIMGFTTELETLREDTFRRLEELRDATDLDERSQDRRLGQDFDEAITFIKASIAKMDRLINAILKLSREGRREFRREAVDMNVLLGSVSASLAHQADAAGASVEIGALPPVESDRLALEQIFSNLVDNALKYLRTGPAGRIKVTGHRVRDRLVYEVADNGRGIDERDQERVFELFRRSGVQDRPGEGIGLAHVRALVRRLGGTIGLTSRPGQGSTFTVILPARWSGEIEREAA